MLKKIWMNLAGSIEYLIVTRLVPQRVGPVMRLLFKTPILFYRLGLGGLIGKHILLLTTTGRRTGKPRVTPLEYGYHAESGVYFLMSGWNGRSDWYRNARACPRVELQAGRQHITGLAEPASDADVVLEMEQVLRVYPKAVNTWARYSGVPYDGTRDSLLRMASAFPSLFVVPDKSGSLT